MRKLRTGCLVFIFMILLCNAASAAEPLSDNFQIAHPVDQKTTTTLNSSRAVMQPRMRGSILSLATLALGNPGDGTIAVDAMTACHVSVDQISMSISLWRYHEEDDSWSQENYRDFHFYAEDYPDQDFDMVMLSYDITGQETGYYYALRGYHAVWKDGIMQSFRTTTDGIRITD